MTIRLIPRTVCLVLALVNAVWAQDATFNKSALVTASGAKTTPVAFVVSNSGITIRSKGKAPAAILDLPYSSITSLGYTISARGRSWLFPVMGPSALWIKGEIHWLVIESGDGAAKKTTVLHLDKSEYLNVVGTLTARSGKHVEMLAPGSTLLDPTAGSHDEDQIVAFPIDQVRDAMKSAMDRCLCKVGKSDPGRLTCNRPFHPSGSIGGNETVTALLEPQGQQTQVIIKTEKALGRNWSSPILRETLQILQGVH